ncbi:MAG: hypothetical protein ACYSWU_05195 [Planctomycetota bacterium]|jgi:hypothetical protein
MANRLQPDAETIRQGIYTLAESVLGAGIVHRDEIKLFADSACQAVNEDARGAVVTELLVFLTNRLRDMTGQLRRRAKRELT